MLDRFRLDVVVKRVGHYNWFDPERERLIDLWRQYKEKGDKSILTGEVLHLPPVPRRSQLVMEAAKLEGWAETFPTADTCPRSA
jgi:hypothetical protein